MPAIRCSARPRRASVGPFLDRADRLCPSDPLGAGSRRAHRTLRADLLEEIGSERIEREGAEHVLKVRSGLKLLEIIRDAGLPIEAACAGSCASVPSHAEVAGDWAGRVGAQIETKAGPPDLAGAVQGSRDFPARRNQRRSRRAVGRTGTGTGRARANATSRQTVRAAPRPPCRRWRRKVRAR